MTTEEKELLLKDLSARLPYGVLCSIGLDYPLPLQRLFIDKLDGILLDFYEDGKDYQVYLSEVKPYLRSMEDMTEEEKKELRLLKDSFDFNCYTAGNYSFQVNLAVADWLLKNHFDYRGLIPMGLAIRVTKENNPYKD